MKFKALLFLLFMTSSFLYAEKITLEPGKTLSSEQIQKMISSTKKADKLHKASVQGAIDEMKRLLGYPPVPVNAVDEYKRTPLHWAVMAGKYKAAKFLIKHGAAIDRQDDEGKAALHYAVIANESKIAKMLINKKAVI